MPKEFPEAEVFEIKKTELKNPIIFAGFVGAGLVGPVAINHIIEKLKMEEIAVMRSKYLPPSTVFMRGRLRHPFRFYANKEGTICAIICEITLRMEGLYSLVASILDWAAIKGSKEIVILDGVASTEHDDKAYCAAEEDLIRTMADKDISMIPQGFITGIPGGILNECLVREIQGLTLLAKASRDTTDSGAAATLIDALNRFYDIDIDTTDLQEEKDRIHSEFSELSQKYVEHREEIAGMYM
ncbi:PAC2 domain containing protein [Marine Group I thaumarchaeote SCGC AAA799-E16]|uniref:PAC2 domain containing protein n=8 Tax=Marine Group I TaxID=905826 RepID=A0A087S6F1_9ARCH|nr:PAC2 domain containing protein [Marine Group I thaumarchaeote SCGC AAA799-E16]KFM16627.1 PAC2 domain containing protein [Marine Group I thaumarchaeote SCGC AAA799-D11]KFM18680.1 PAC2 domain containing protein [Marine Group I thaumarchaeote SCGC RSA3]KFM21305.1 PAC2 domain containing protein [Marine Group I thaumarchaeote SCGC AAA799-B03]